MNQTYYYKIDHIVKDNKLYQYKNELIDISTKSDRKEKLNFMIKELENFKDPKEIQNENITSIIDRNKQIHEEKRFKMTKRAI
jgi:hypothetical protein